MNIDAILYEKLLELAKDKKMASYSEVAPLIGLNISQEQDRDVIAQKLGDIVLFEHENNRPMLTALVVHHAEALDREAGGVVDLLDRLERALNKVSVSGARTYACLNE